MFGKKKSNNVVKAGVEAISKGDKDVWLIYSGLVDADAVTIAGASKASKSLENLYNDIGNKGATAIATVVRDNFSLQGLSLDKNQIGDAGAVSIANALKENNTLRRLDLSTNLITDAGVTAIAQALIGNDSLGSLSFFGNKGVTEKSVNILKQMLKFSYVTDLNLTCTDIGDTSKEELEALAKIPIDKRSISKRTDRFSTEVDTSISSESISS